MHECVYLCVCLCILRTWILTVPWSWSQSPNWHLIIVFDSHDLLDPANTLLFYTHDFARLSFFCHVMSCLTLSSFPSVFWLPVYRFLSEWVCVFTQIKVNNFNWKQQNIFFLVCDIKFDFNPKKKIPKVFFSLQSNEFIDFSNKSENNNKKTLIAFETQLNNFVCCVWNLRRKINCHEIMLTINCVETWHLN